MKTTHFVITAVVFLLCVKWTHVSSQSTNARTTGTPPLPQASAQTTTMSVENPTIPAGSRTCTPSLGYSDLICSVTTRSGARCSGDGYCRCHNVPHADECTCLVHYGGCRVRSSSSAENAAAVPSYQGSVQSTRSCTANDNCEYSVHVISVYEARNRGFRDHAPGSASVSVTVGGDSNDTRPLILVLASYEAIEWSLSVPQGVVFEKIIVGSYYIDQTSVSGVSSLTSIEKLSSCSSTIQCYADGYDDDTVEQLQYISSRYGPVSSWTNAYRANSWDLHIRKNGCTMEPVVPEIASCPFVPPVTTTQPPTPPSTSAQPTTSPQNPSVPSVPASQTACDPMDSRSRDFLCSARTRYGARCSGDGYCRCPDTPNVDECTCFVNYGSCRVRSSSSAENAAAVPSYQGSVQSTRSCTANDNCEYSVHVISVYEARNRGFRDHAPGSASVSVTVDGDSSDTRPLILVLASYEAIEWSLSVPQGVTFEKIIVDSYYIDQTTVSGVSSLTSIEKLSRCSLCYADGYDDDTVEQLQYISNRYGSVSSWTNAYRADAWNLRIRKNGCTMEPVVPEVESCPFIPSLTATTQPSLSATTRPPALPSTSAQPLTTPSVQESIRTCDPTSRYPDFSCGGIRPGARCSGDGYCRCPNMPNVNECTCLDSYRSCQVESSPSAQNAAAVPSYRGTIQETESCTANDNCEYSVHVISVYEARNRGFRDHAPGSASVSITVDGDSSNTRPLILFLVSYEPIRWSLFIPQGVTFEKIIVASYYIDQTSVSASSGTSIERLRSCFDSLPCYPNGHDDDTIEWLEYISERYGVVSSFTSAYRANSWNFKIKRNGCTSTPLTSDPVSCEFVPIVNSTVVIASVVSTLVVVLIIITVLIMCKICCCRRHGRPRQSESSNTEQTRVNRLSVITQQSSHLHNRPDPPSYARVKPANTGPIVDSGSTTFMSSAPPAYHDALCYPPPKNVPDSSPQYSYNIIINN